MNQDHNLYCQHYIIHITTLYWSTGTRIHMYMYMYMCICSSQQKHCNTSSDLQLRLVQASYMYLSFALYSLLMLLGKCCTFSPIKASTKYFYTEQYSTSWNMSYVPTYAPSPQARGHRNQAIVFITLYDTANTHVHVHRCPCTFSDITNQGYC